MIRKPYGSTPLKEILPTIQLKVDFGTEVNDVMLRVLRELCKEDRWVKLGSITEDFKAKIGWNKCPYRKVGAILTQLGFNRRMRKADGYYVLIDQQTLVRHSV